jgi:glycosyltransferase involved in cell wall biosynthesis
VSHRPLLWRALALVDVVIPTRDRHALVGDAVRSALRQTHRDVVVWVVDNGSKPVELPADVVSDPRLRVLQTGEPVSAGTARNLALRSGSAPFVAFLDDDDRWRARKTERQLALLERSPARVAGVSGAWLLARRRGRPVVDLPDPGPDPVIRLLEHPVHAPSVVIIRRDVLEDVGLFPEYSDRTEDWALWLDVVRAGYDIAVLQEVVADRLDSEPPPERMLAGFEAYHRRVRPLVDALSPAIRARILARQEFDRAVQVARSGRRLVAARMLLRAWRGYPRAWLPAFHLLRTVTGERAWGLVADHTRGLRS